MSTDNGHFRLRIDSMRVGGRIRRRRQALRLSQKDLAVDGITAAYISRIERGTRKPSLGALIAIADQLDTTANYLVTGRHAPPADGCPYCGR